MKPDATSNFLIHCATSKTYLIANKNQYSTEAKEVHLIISLHPERLEYQNCSNRLFYPKVTAVGLPICLLGGEDSVHEMAPWKKGSVPVVLVGRRSWSARRGGAMVGRTTGLGTGAESWSRTAPFHRPLKPD